jgi:hypothetical protein
MTRIAAVRRSTAGQEQRSSDLGRSRFFVCIRCSARSAGGPPSLRMTGAAAPGLAQSRAVAPRAARTMPGKVKSLPVPESAKPSKSIRKGCLPALALYGLPAIVYYYLFHFVFAAELGELDWAVALGAGLLTVIGLSLVFFGGDWRLLGASSSWMLVDGQRIAVCGRSCPSGDIRRTDRQGARAPGPASTLGRGRIP